MKTVFLNNGRIGGRRSLTIAAMLLLGVLGAHAQFKSPVGTWDFMLNGSGQQGIAFVTFVADSPGATTGSFFGYELITSPHDISVAGGRSPGGDAGRGDSNSATNAVATNDFLFGFGPVSGPWESDTSGRVIGFFDQVVNASGPTVNWLGACVEAFVPYATAVTTSNGVVDSNAVMNIAFCLTNSVFATNIDWTSTNADGTTNQYEVIFGLGPTNAEVDLFYSNIAPLAFTNSFTNFEFALVGESSLSTNVTWDTTALSGTTTSSAISFTFTPVISGGSGAGTSTNGVSFTGTVAPGRRFVLTSTPTSLKGKVIYTGVPYRTNLKDLSGSWYGYKHENSHPYLEFFSLASVGATNLAWPPDWLTTLGTAITNFPTIYLSTNGLGPGYSMDGLVMESAWKRIGFLFITTPDGSDSGTNALMSAMCGSLSTSASGARATTKGVEDPGAPMLFNGTFRGR